MHRANTHVSVVLSKKIHRAFVNASRRVEKRKVCEAVAALTFLHPAPCSFFRDRRIIYSREFFDVLTVTEKFSL
jgi:hypothetical protein